MVRILTRLSMASQCTWHAGMMPAEASTVWRVRRRRAKRLNYVYPADSDLVEKIEHRSSMESVMRIRDDARR